MDPILRPDPESEDDLRWYFNESSGAMGLKSNFAGMVMNIQAPRSHGNSCAAVIGEHQVEAASRARWVSRVLTAVGEDHARTLRAAYQARQSNDPAAAALKAFGELGSLVLESPATVEYHRRSRSQKPLLDWLLRISRKQASPAARSQCAEVRRDAEARLAKAARAYVEAKRQLVQLQKRLSHERRETRDALKAERIRVEQPGLLGGVDGEG